ncbi:MAG: GNAT family N-acetyltransferase [Deltaproteobacteria bacterium]|nr:GNAT family N-acetyltransferase [Deltaproteobacteria bacterium]
METKLTVRVLKKVSDVQRDDWDHLLKGGSPFLRWDWLDALEKTGCASSKTGWLPQHIVIEKKGKPVAACPMYLKGHSMGEFVFDHEWAHFATRSGIQYYPKMLVAVPFTPVTGMRFLTDPKENRSQLTQLLGQTLIQICRENNISSVHVNFCLEDESEVLKKFGFLPKIGLQFHWQNHGYQTFDDYLESFRSDRRNKIKKERRELDTQGIRVRAVEGDELSPGLLKTMFHLYKTHIDELYYGRQYLNMGFFEELAHRFKDYVCLVIAEKDSRVIAGTLNAQDEVAMYGRYWGALEYHRFLHFNVCYYSAIEHCVQKGLQRFEAGAGGSFKGLRGLEPEMTYSMHYISDERFRKVLREHLQEERSYTASKQSALLARSPLKKGAENAG